MSPIHTIDPAVPMCTLPKGIPAFDVNGLPLLNYVEVDPKAVPAQHPELPSCLPASTTASTTEAPTGTATATPTP